MSEQIELRPAGSAAIDTHAWQTRAAQLLRRMVDAGNDPAECTDALRDALVDIDLRDPEQRPWRYDGSGWWCWHAQAWVPATAPATLYLASVSLSAPAEVSEDSEVAGGSEPATVFAPPSPP